MADLDRQKELAGGQKRNLLHRAMRNRVWLINIPHHLIGTEFSQEEFQDNSQLRYGLVPQDISATCDICGKRISIEHALSCSKGGLVLAQHNDAVKK